MLLLAGPSSQPPRIVVRFPTKPEAFPRGTYVTGGPAPVYWETYLRDVEIAPDDLRWKGSGASLSMEKTVQLRDKAVLFPPDYVLTLHLLRLPFSAPIDRWKQIEVSMLDFAHFNDRTFVLSYTKHAGDRHSRVSYE